LGAALLLGLFAGLSIWEMAGDSPTHDEVIHLPVGYAYWKTREFRLNPEHPPLVKLLCSIPLLALDLKMPSVNPGDHQTTFVAGIEKASEEYQLYNSFQLRFGSKFLFTQDADLIMFWGRLPAVGLGLVLAWFVFRWSSKLHRSAGAGLLSLFLLALDPTILAHSHYVTSDVPLACFSVMAMFFLWSFCRDGKLSHLVAAALGLALALTSKFSAIFLVPMFFSILLFAWPQGGLRMPGGTAGAVSLQSKVLACLGVALGVALVVQASYLFSPDPGLYFRGIQAVNLNHIPGVPVYVAGKFYPGGVWWYSLYAFVIKTPIPLLIAIGAGAIECVRRRRSLDRAVFCVLIPPLVYGVAVCALADNLGVRYMIPVTPFLLVLAGQAFITIRRSRAGAALGSLLGIWLLVSVLRTSPYHIAYFNEFVGGAENGAHYLDDSNVDWGQDLRRLAQSMQRQGVREPILSYWGSSPPTYYGDRFGITFKPWLVAMAVSEKPPPGVYAISVNHLVELEVPDQKDSRLDWLRRFQPSEKIGYSIYVFRFR
jgi:4-amino-4-deoxy-L-arabinose transferase-like glycosyltransferase